MYKYPSEGQLRARAKYVSRTLGLKLSYAKDFVATCFHQANWDELVKLSGSAFDDEYIAEFLPPTHAEIDRFKSIVQPFEADFRAILNDKIHCQSSVIRKVANGNYSSIARDIMLHLFGVVDERMDDGSICFDPTDKDAVISEIQFREDTISRALHYFHEGKETPARINPWIEPSVLGIKMYGYYYFISNNHINFVIREFDTDIEDPKNGKPLEQKKWFVDLIIGYLRHTAYTLHIMGYKGKIRLTTINNYYASGIKPDYRGNRYEEMDNGQSDVYRKLFKLGAEWEWDDYDDGSVRESFHGPSITIERLAKS